MMSASELHRFAGLVDKFHIPGDVGRKAGAKLTKKPCVMCNNLLTVQEHAKYLMVCARCGEDGRKHVHVDQYGRARVVETNGEAY